jgi:hypothetical protein
MIVELTRIRSATLARARFPFTSSFIIAPKRLQGVPITVIYTDVLNKPGGIGVKSPLD